MDRTVGATWGKRGGHPVPPLRTQVLQRAIHPQLCVGMPAVRLLKVINPTIV